MWRVGLLLAVCLGVAVVEAEAARLSRAPCADRDSTFCDTYRNTYRGAPGYSGQRFSRSRASRSGGKHQPLTAQPGKAGQAYSTAAPPAMKPAAEPASAKLLPARFDAFANGGGSVESAASAPAGTPNPWVNPILIALAGGGILSLFLARAAEL